MPNALSDDLFNPLDLDDALERAYDEGGLESVVDLLELALADPRAAGDPELPGYLDELAETYGELERYDDAIRVAERIIALDPDQRVEELTWMAGLYAMKRDTGRARSLLRDLRAEHLAAPAADRDLWHGLSAAVVLADHVGDTAEAARWLAEDIRTAIAAGAEPDLVKALDTHRRRVAPKPDPALDQTVREYGGTAAEPRRPHRPRGQIRAGYLPAEEFAEAASRGLLAGPEDEPPADHSDHRRRIELEFRSQPPGSQRVVPITVADLVAYAEKAGIDPAGPYARLRYAEDSPEPGIIWPPDRNDDCWCGSDRKYKKCCRAF